MSLDREYRIRISTAADNTGAEAAKQGLAEVSGQTEKYTNASKVATAETENLSLSHRELHLALAQLGPEFAHIGGMAQYALHNQVLAPVLGIVGAFALWEHRVNACVEALGGVELPDNAKEQVGQIHALAESWRTFNKALTDAATGYGSVDEASKRSLETLKAEEDQKRKLLEADKKLALSELEKQKGALSPAEYEDRKAQIERLYGDKAAGDDDEARFKRLQEKAKRGAALEESSKQKMAEAAKIRIGTPEQEAAIDEQMRLQAEAAEKEAKAREDRLNDLYGAKDVTGSFSERFNRGIRLIGRYGADVSSPEGLEEAIKLEKEGGAAEQIVIDRYKNRMKGKTGRDDLIERRKKLVDDAGKEAGEAYRIWQEGPGDVAAYHRAVDNQRAVAATNAQAARNTADAAITNSGEGKMFIEAAHAEAIKEHGGKLSTKQATVLVQTAALLKALNENAESNLRALAAVHGNTAALNHRVLELEREIHRHGKQFRSQAAPL